MNFLAHALLAGDDPALIVGGVIGDWIKGPLPGVLPGDLARGVALHRAIDSFAELHPGFRASRTRVSAPRRRYAGVLVDIFYDHLLARHWTDIHHQPLDAYCRHVYQTLAARLDQIPQASHRGLMLMAGEDWLGSYARMEAIADVLVRMSRRARQPNPLAGGEQELLGDVAGYTDDFHGWFADAKRFAERWRSA
jgi:acyl carrier protein phosphodiesterase